MEIVAAYNSTKINDIKTFNTWSNVYFKPSVFTTYKYAPIVEIYSPWISNKYKCTFSNEVLPNLQKGWKLVAVNSNIKCTDCYIYGNGVGSSCNNYTNIINNYCNGICDTWMNYNEFKQMSKKKYYYTYTDFNYLHTINDDLDYSISDNLNYLFDDIKLINMV